MYCQRCGAGNPDSSVTCSACGVALVAVPAAAVEAKTSGLAIVALVLGILGFFTCGITVLPAIICGIIALVQISGSGGRLKGTGAAVAGIVLPTVSAIIIPIVAMLLAILMPALSQVKSIAQRVVCGTNLKGLATAIIVYADGYDGRLPTADAWCDLLMQEADVSEQSFHCPGAPEGTCNYALNSNLRTVSGPNAAWLVALFECSPGWNQAGGPELLTTEYHQGEGCNVAFADGHTEFVRADYLERLKWTTDE